MTPVAYVHSPFPEKFGIPRQGNLAPHVVSKVILEEPFRQGDCLRGLEAFSHIWLIWGFHRHGEEWHATVRPPRLGGNERMGVFATRSPFRPNGLGLSVVRLLAVERGGILRISGADMVDGTPVYDIKPYVPYADAISDAVGGFTETPWHPLEVQLPEQLPSLADETWQQALRETLAQDPRPAYQRDEHRCYHLILEPFEVHFHVQNGAAIVDAIHPRPCRK